MKIHIDVQQVEQVNQVRYLCSVISDDRYCVVQNMLELELT